MQDDKKQRFENLGKPQAILRQEEEYQRKIRNFEMQQHYLNNKGHYDQ